jgi:hypothetical protein
VLAALSNCALRSEFKTLDLQENGTRFIGIAHLYLYAVADGEGSSENVEAAKVCAASSA